MTPPNRPSQDQRKLLLIQAYQATIANQWDIVWKDDVTDVGSLPMTGNSVNDHRLVLFDWFVRRRTGTSWLVIGPSGSWVLPPLIWADTPIITGAVPRYIGDEYIDITGPTRYWAYGLTTNDRIA